MNEIKIDGRICNQNKTTFSSGKCVTRFGLHIYNGKKDGNKVYDFIDCKYFGALDIPDKTKVVVSGWLGVESWEKDGHTNKRVVVYAKEVGKDIAVGMTKPETDNTNDFTDDDIPF